MRHRVLAGVTMLAALLTSVPCVLSAQAVDPARIIDLHVNVEDQNRSFGGSVVEGTQFYLTFQGRGAYALAPVPADPSGRVFLVTVLRGEGVRRPESYRRVEVVRARVGVPTPIPSLPRVTVVIEGTRTAEAASNGLPALYQLASTRRSVLAPFQTSYCCLTCGGVTTCGCRQSNDCGFCCVMPCCPKQALPTAASATPLLGAPRTFAELSGSGCRSVPDHERLFTPSAGATTVLASRR